MHFSGFRYRLTVPSGARKGFRLGFGETGPLEKIQYRHLE